MCRRTTKPPVSTCYASYAYIQQDWVMHPHIQGQRWCLRSFTRKEEGGWKRKHTGRLTSSIWYQPHTNWRVLDFVFDWSEFVSVFLNIIDLTLLLLLTRITTGGRIWRNASRRAAPAADYISPRRRVPILHVGAALLHQCRPGGIPLST